MGEERVVLGFGGVWWGRKGVLSAGSGDGYEEGGCGGAGGFSGRMRVERRFWWVYEYLYWKASWRLQRLLSFGDSWAFWGRFVG